MLLYYEHCTVASEFRSLTLSLVMEMSRAVQLWIFNLCSLLLALCFFNYGKMEDTRKVMT